MTQPIAIPAKEKRVRHTLRVPEGLDIMVRALARNSGQSINDVYVMLVGEALRAVASPSITRERGRHAEG